MYIQRKCVIIAVIVTEPEETAAMHKQTPRRFSQPGLVRHQHCPAG